MQSVFFSAYFVNFAPAQTSGMLSFQGGKSKVYHKVYFKVAGMKKLGIQYLEWFGQDLFLFYESRSSYACTKFVCYFFYLLLLRKHYIPDPAMKLLWTESFVIRSCGLSRIGYWIFCANFIAPSPTNMQCGVSSITLRASDTGLAISRTQPTAP